MGFEEHFACNPVLLIVIHVENETQALHNVAVARENDADGVFLINHRIPAGQLSTIYTAVRNEHPDWWIGLNFLDLVTEDAICKAASLNCSGLWVDNAGIHENQNDPTVTARHLLALRRRQYPQWHGLYFGGVAFKYQ